jgi:hypothetical protein
MSVRFTNSIACISVGSKITVKAVPAQIQFESMGDCISKEYNYRVTIGKFMIPIMLVINGKIILGILWGQILTL